jgi:hypothetical protein
MSVKQTNKYECSICCEQMVDNDRVICPFCNVEICETCFQYSTTLEIKTPSCIFCKKELSLEFVLANNDHEWCKTKFIPFFENLMYEKEKMLLPESIESYKKMIKIRELKANLKQYKPTKTLTRKIEIELLKGQDVTEIEKQILNRFEIENELTELTHTEVKTNEKKIYISNCINENCRGFITNKYECELCKTKICDECLQINNENHKCNRNDTATAREIKNSSKPCPKCYVPIFKISGCNQMFCTNCKVVFDWTTMQIDNGSVHNEYYFDWISSANNDNMDIEEIACGDIETIYRIIMNKNGCSYQTLFLEVYQFNRECNGEHIDVYQRKIKNKFDLYRIEYLDNKLTIEKWKKKIAVDNIYNEKIDSIIKILRMYVTITSDLLRLYAYDNINVKEFYLQNKTFHAHFVQCLCDTNTIFGNGDSITLALDIKLIILGRLFKAYM